jgi:type IV pilus assembly protein PilA
MIDALRKRLRREEKGFTLIELLVVIIILGILVAIAVPSYLSFKGRATNSSSQANIRTIVPDIEAYYSDNGTYATMTLALLKSTYDQALDTTKYALPAADQTATSYCIQSPSAGGTPYSKAGPAASITQAACP